MRYIKSYHLFESEETEIDITKTEEDPKLDAENTETKENVVKSIQAQIKEYSNKKGQIDTAYKTIKDDYQLKLAVERILGRDIKNRNQFLVQYEQFALMERNLNRLQNQIIQDTSSIAKYNKEVQSLNELLRIEQNTNNQVKLKESIKKTGDMILKFKSNITNNNKNIPKLKQALLGKKTFLDSMKAKISQISNISTEK